MDMAVEQGGAGARDPLAGTAYSSSHVLGRGATGTVYAARHRRLGKRVCVKLVHASLAASSETIDRMRMEAQAMATLDGHPNLLVVTDLGETPAGQPFLVTERLVGRTLSEERTQRGEMPIDEAVALVLQLLAGLAAAHAQGIVHRDIKPANLFVCEPRPGETQRVLKILDFGILKLVAAAPASRAIAPAAAPTEAGVAIGTPRYFSPEQAAGMAVDARADLHAVGAVLYGLVAGQGPFDEHTDLTTLLRAIAFHAPAPASTHAKQAIPAWLDRVLMHALEKRPERRFQTAEAFAEALRLGASTPAPAPASAPALSSPAPVALQPAPSSVPVTRTSRRIWQWAVAEEGGAMPNYLAMLLVISAISCVAIAVYFTWLKS